MANGWEMIQSGIRDLGQIYDPYNTISVSETLKKLFGGKKKLPDSVSVAVPDLEGPQINFDPFGQSADESFQFQTGADNSDPFQFKADPLPAADVKPMEQPTIGGVKVSTDNPVLQELNKGGFFGRKPSLQAIMAAQAWEDDANKRSIAQQMAELSKRKGEQDLLRGDLSLRTGEKQLELLNQKPVVEQFNYEPSNYTGMFSGRNPWAGYLANPNNFRSRDEVAEAYKNAVQWEEDQKQPTSKTNDRGNIDLSRQYKDVVEGGYTQYLNNTKTRNAVRVENGENPQAPLRFNDWIRQPENKDALRVYNDYNNSNLQSLS
jgi:hypothetical protein